MNSAGGAAEWSCSAANQGLRLSSLGPHSGSAQGEGPSSGSRLPPPRPESLPRPPGRRNREGVRTSPAQLQVRVAAQLLHQLLLRGLLQDVPAERGRQWTGRPGRL